MNILLSLTHYFIMESKLGELISSKFVLFMKLVYPRISITIEVLLVFLVLEID